MGNRLPGVKGNPIVHCIIVGWEIFRSASPVSSIFTHDERYSFIHKFGLHVIEISQQLAFFSPVGVPIRLDRGMMAGAPRDGKTILDAETDNSGALSDFFLHPKESAAVMSIANNARGNFGFMSYYSFTRFRKKTSFSLISKSFEKGIPFLTSTISFRMGAPSFRFFICSTCCLLSCAGLPKDR